MRFRNQGDDLVYFTPDEATLARPEVIATAAELSVELLYPMSGLETEEPVLQPGRIDVLLGQGQTAQVLRNLCLLVYRESPDDWDRIAELMKRLFYVQLGKPQETARGSITLFYRQDDVKELLEVSLAGRGFQQMLLIFAYLYSHRHSVLLIDEPDAHLEILRQKQVYVLLREIAAENESQVVMVTHSEVVLAESLERNLTLLLEGQADDLAARPDILNALKYHGAEHYIRARQRGYVLYVEGRTDVDMLRAFARRLNHRVANSWDERANVFYVMSNFPSADLDAELARVEGGFNTSPKEHFFALRELVPGLRGLAILDNDGRGRDGFNQGGLQISYWNRYEAENYFITPDLLMRYTRHRYSDMPLFGQFESETREILDSLVLERVFSGRDQDFATWRGLDAAAARLLWEATTERIKLSDFAEEFFRRLASQLGHAMLLRKGELHRLVDLSHPASLPEEISEKLDLLADLFDEANPGENT